MRQAARSLDIDFSKICSDVLRSFAEVANSTCLIQRIASKWCFEPEDTSASIRFKEKSPTRDSWFLSVFANFVQFLHFLRSSHAIIHWFGVRQELGSFLSVIPEVDFHTIKMNLAVVVFEMTTAMRTPHLRLCSMCNSSSNGVRGVHHGSRLDVLPATLARIAVACWWNRHYCCSLLNFLLYRKKLVEPSRCSCGFLVGSCGPKGHIDKTPRSSLGTSLRDMPK